MSLLRRLSAHGLDGEMVYARLRATESMGDDPMWQQLMSSTLGRAGAWLIEISVRSATDSTAVKMVRQVRRVWDAWPPTMRLRGIGLMTVTAVATHLAMTASTPVPGPWRLLLPGLAGTFGFLALSLSYFGPRAARERV